MTFKKQPTCACELHIADDEGDNWATMICGLAPGHEGQHEERYPRGDRETMVTVCWFGDDRDTQGKSSEGGK